MNATVSVIIPCFNQARYLPDCIASLQAQTYLDWEAIIVNDGSTDDTRGVALSFAADDPRVRYVEQENRGLAGARNTGLDNARGDYIQFLDADDLIDPAKLFLQVAALSDANKLALCYSDYRHCPEDDVTRTTGRGNLPPPRLTMTSPLHDLAARWETKLSIPVHSFLFDARFFRDKGIRFDETLPTHEDWDCWMQIFALEPEVRLTPGPLAIYRLRSAAMCSNTEAMWRGFRKAIQKQQRIFRHDPLMRSILMDKMRETRLMYARKRSSTRLRSTRGFLVRAYLRLAPWPIQKFVSRVRRAVLRARDSA